MGEKAILRWIEYPSLQRMDQKITGPRRRGSPLTTRTYAWGVYYFCGGMGYSDPETALEDLKAKRRVFVKEVDSFIETRLNLGNASKTVHAWLSGIKKWAIVNDVDVSGWEKIEQPRVETVEEDRAPKAEEVRALMDIENPRDRVITAIAISSGLRIGTLVTLRWREFDFDSYEDIGIIKVSKDVGRKFQNSKAKYFMTFITPETKKLLLQHRLKLQNQGMDVSLDAFVFPSRQRERISVSQFRNQWNLYLKQLSLNKKFRRTYELHVHTLRKFFRTQCEVSGVKRSFFEHWMGHKGGYLDDSYFRPELETHVEEYRKAIPNLTIYGTQIPSEVSKKLEKVDVQSREIQELREEVVSLMDYNVKLYDLYYKLLGRAQETGDLKIIQPILEFMKENPVLGTKSKSG